MYERTHEIYTSYVLLIIHNAVDNLGVISSWRPKRFDRALDYQGPPPALPVTRLRTHVAFHLES